MMPSWPPSHRCYSCWHTEGGSQAMEHAGYPIRQTRIKPSRRIGWPPPRSEACGVASSDRAPVVQGSGGSASATSGCGLGGCRVPVDVNIRESSGTKPGSTRSTLVEVTATARVPTSMSIGLGPTGLIVCFVAPAHRAGQSHATPNGEACKANQQVRSNRR